MTRRGTLFIISGSSGVGKGTINNAVLARLSNVKLSVSATTREMRPGEADGRDYFFIGPEEFAQKIQNDEFLEYAKVYHHMYGTPKKSVLKNLEKGFDVILEIDVQGAAKIKKTMPDGVFIFIQPPSIEALEQRIKGRGKDSPQSIEARLKACHIEMPMAKYYDYVVVNDQLDEAINKVQSIIIAERCRVKNFIKE